VTASEALLGALAGEHAAIYAYGPIGARLSSRNAVEARAAERAHRDRRDALVLRLSSGEVTPPPAATAYTLPFPVTGKAAALRLAVQVEERTAALWRAALRETTGADRRLALDALTDCAVRATRFRRAAGVTPITVPFPGRVS
jgi:hypothetical protein